MNLYLVSSKDERDDYEAFVVAASTKEVALHTHPDGSHMWDEDKKAWYRPHKAEDFKWYDGKVGGWTSRLELVDVKLIGKAVSWLEGGQVVLASDVSD